MNRDLDLDALIYFNDCLKYVFHGIKAVGLYQSILAWLRFCQCEVYLHKADAGPGMLKPIVLNQNGRFRYHLPAWPNLPPMEAILPRSRVHYKIVIHADPVAVAWINRRPALSRPTWRFREAWQ